MWRLFGALFIYGVRRAMANGSAFIGALALNALFILPEVTHTAIWRQLLYL